MRTGASFPRASPVRLCAGAPLSHSRAAARGVRGRAPGRDSCHHQFLFALFNRTPLLTPQGLVKDINSLGLKFGIWVEPEMINVNSQLYRALPTWTLNQHGRKSRCEGRNQLVLDFTLEGVCVLEQAEEILRGGVGELVGLSWQYRG